MSNDKSAAVNLVVALLLAAMLIQGIVDINGMSVTWDEAMYVGIGNFVIRNAHFDFTKIEGLHFHPIWTFYLNSLLLLFLRLPAEALSIPDGSVYTATAGSALLFHSGYRPETILFLARFPILVQSVFLGFLLYRFARELFGIRAALVALTLLAFDPNFIVHSSIAATDASMTVWIFATTYFYWRYLQSPTVITIVITGVCLGLALLSKASALFVLLLMIPAMLIVHARLSVLNALASLKKDFQGHLKEIIVAAGKCSRHIVSLVLIASLMIWAAYGFGITSTYKSEAELAAANVHGLKAAIQSTNFVRLPLAPYFDVLAYVIMGAVGIPRHAYLLGQHSVNGFRQYIFIDFLIKTPVPTLLLLAIVCLLWRRLPRAKPAAEIGLIMGMIVPILLAIPEKSNCGIRYVLGLYPFLYVFVSRIAGSDWTKSLTARPKLALNITICTLLLWQCFDSLRCCPNQIAYFNTFFTDPAKKFHYVVDSNLDWGNELYALRDFMKEKGISEINLDYFGNVNPAEYGIRWRQATTKSTGWIAISASNLAGAYGSVDWSAFRTSKPVAILSGGGMLVYYR